jgi:hypothetical protein
MAAPFEQLQDWYAAQCDGEWEHDYGVDIGTLDNPGWRIRIALAGTALAPRELERIHIARAETDWVEAWLEDGGWHAACGPLNLAEALGLFLAWADHEGDLPGT